MTKNSVIPIEVKKPFETVYELKNEMQSIVGDQTPSFDDFMKNYEYDDNLNYDDLSSGGIGEAKGHGPCEYYNCPYSSNCRFYLKIGFSGSEFEILQKNRDCVCGAFS